LGKKARFDAKNSLFSGIFWKVVSPSRMALVAEVAFHFLERRLLPGTAIFQGQQQVCAYWQCPRFAGAAPIASGHAVINPA
jgi:hypothetical protein